MSKITLNDVTNIGSLSVINSNFDKIEQELQNKVLYRSNPTGEPNTVERDIDMNGNSLLNVGKVYSANGRWATIDEVEDIKDEVAANAVIVEANKDIAVASATVAATSYDNFDDRYLGQKTADPSVDNDGGLLLTGALYFRTSGTPIMRVYNGTTWQDVGSITTTTTNLIDASLYSSQAEAEAGVNNTKVMTPLRVKNAIDKQVKEGFTSTGAIVLPGNAVDALQAVPKQQAESIADSVASSYVVNRFRYQATSEVATTSGASVDFLTLPSWAKKITITFDGVSTNGANILAIQLGTSSGLVTTGYLSAAGQTSAASVSANFYSGGLLLSQNNSSSDLRFGHMLLTKNSSNTWIASSVSPLGNVGSVGYGGGRINLPGVLDKIRITTVGGTDIFDAGSVFLLIEG